MIANNPHFLVGDPSLMLELTVAGYDLDNSIKVAEITLVPRRERRGDSVHFQVPPPGLYTPICAFTAGFEQLPEPYSDPRLLSGNGPVMFAVKDAMFCEIAG